jgi:hypothetical protein
MKNFIIKTLIYLNSLSLIICVSGIDYAESWRPYALMTFNAAFLFFVAYANGWIYDTEPRRQRIKAAKRDVVGHPDNETPTGCNSCDEEVV